MHNILSPDGLRPVDQDRLTVCTNLRWAFRPHRPHQIQPPIQPFPKLSGADIVGAPQLGTRPKFPNSGTRSGPFAVKQRYPSHMKRSSAAGEEDSALAASRSAGMGWLWISRKNSSLKTIMFW